MIRYLKQYFSRKKTRNLQVRIIQLNSQSKNPGIYNFSVRQLFFAGLPEPEPVGAGVFG